MTRSRQIARDRLILPLLALQLTVVARMRAAAGACVRYAGRLIERLEDRITLARQMTEIYEGVPLSVRAGLTEKPRYQTFDDDHIVCRVSGVATDKRLRCTTDGITLCDPDYRSAAGRTAWLEGRGETVHLNISWDTFALRDTPDVREALQHDQRGAQALRDPFSHDYVAIYYIDPDLALGAAKRWVAHGIVPDTKALEAQDRQLRDSRSGVYAHIEMVASTSTELVH